MWIYFSYFKRFYLTDYPCQIQVWRLDLTKTRLDWSLGEASTANQPIRRQFRNTDNNGLHISNSKCAAGIYFVHSSTMCAYAISLFVIIPINLYLLVKIATNLRNNDIDPNALWLTWRHTCERSGCPMRVSGLVQTEDDPSWPKAKATGGTRLQSLTEKNYWADNSYDSDSEVTIYGQ